MSVGDFIGRGVIVGRGEGGVLDSWAGSADVGPPSGGSGAARTSMNAPRVKIAVTAAAPTHAMAITALRGHRLARDALGSMDTPERYRADRAPGP